MLKMIIIIQNTDKANRYSIVFSTVGGTWGGELNIEGKVIKYKPGDFVLFDSDFYKSLKNNYLIGGLQ